MNTPNDPWIQLTSIEMWSQLAESTTLPDKVMTDIWNTGSQRARRILARRHDLNDTITDAILSGDDPELLCEWLRRERTSEELARLPLHNTGRHPFPAGTDAAESINHHLSWQPNLNPAQLEHVIAHANADARHILLARADLTREQRRLLAVRAVTDNTTSTGKDTTLISAVGYDPATWADIARCAHTGLLATLCDVALSINDRELHHAIAGRLVELLHDNIDPSAGSDVLRLVRVLLRSPHLHPDVYRSMLEHPLLGQLRPQIQQRSEIAVTDLLAGLRHCDPRRGCTDTAHIALIRKLDQVSQDISLSDPTVLRAALAHSEQLDARTYHSVLGRETLTEEVHTELTESGRHDLLADLVLQQGRRCMLLTETDRGVIAILARRGHEAAFNYLHDPQNLPVIVENFAPAAALLAEPDLAGAVAQRLAFLEPSHRDTVYRLLPEWVGDLDSLIQTAAEV